MKTLALALLAALVVVAVWHFELHREVQRIMDWVARLGASPRGHYP